MMIKAILFDLDGTLSDTALGLGIALNKMLDKRNLPNIEINKIRNIVNQGVKGLLYLGFSIECSDAEFYILKKEYLEEYNKCFLSRSVLFDDIDKLIVEINNLQLKWGIITNKSKIFTNRLVDKLKFSTPPAVIVSGDTTCEAKPSIIPMLYATNKIKVNPVNCIYIGDSKTDIEAGKNSGMKTAIAKWGYIIDDVNSWGADYIISRPLDLLNIINK